MLVNSDNTSSFLKAIDVYTQSDNQVACTRSQIRSITPKSACAVVDRDKVESVPGKNNIESCLSKTCRIIKIIDKVQSRDVPKVQSNVILPAQELQDILSLNQLFRCRLHSYNPSVLVISFVLHIDDKLTDTRSADT